MHLPYCSPTRLVSVLSEFINSMMYTWPTVAYDPTRKESGYIHVCIQCMYIAHESLLTNVVRSPVRKLFSCRVSTKFKWRSAPMYVHVWQNTKRLLRNRYISQTCILFANCWIAASAGIRCTYIQTVVAISHSMVILYTSSLSVAVCCIPHFYEHKYVTVPIRAEGLVARKYWSYVGHTSFNST